MPSNVIGEAWIQIKPDTSMFESALTKGTSGALSAVNKGMLTIGASIIGVAALALDLNTKLQSSLSQIDARMGITASAGNAIGAAFLSTAGEATSSATEMAAAFAPVSGELALLNHGALTSSQSLEFMNVAMDLADATGNDLATTVSTLTDVLQAYQLPISQATAVSDILYSASNALGISIDDLSSTVDKLHAKLGPIAPSLSDVASLLADVSTHGVTGSRALLLVTTAMNTLLGGTKATNGEIKALNLQVFNSRGQFVGMSDILAQLSPKLAKMTEAQRLLAEKELFGSSASKALDATILAGLPGWEKASNVVNNTGAAQAAANISTNNLGGAWKRLSSQVSDMLTKAGTPLNKFLTDVVNNLDKNLQPAVNEAIKTFPVWGRILAGIVVTWIAWNTAVAVSKLITTIQFIVTVGIPAMISFAAATAAAVGPWVALAAAVAGVGYYFGVLISNTGKGSSVLNTSQAGRQQGPGAARFGGAVIPAHTTSVTINQTNNHSGGTQSDMSAAIAANNRSLITALWSI